MILSETMVQNLRLNKYKTYTYILPIFTVLETSIHT